MVSLVAAHVCFRIYSSVFPAIIKHLVVVTDRTCIKSRSDSLINSENTSVFIIPHHFANCQIATIHGGSWPEKPTTTTRGDVTVQEKDAAAYRSGGELHRDETE